MFNGLKVRGIFDFKKRPILSNDGGGVINFKNNKKKSKFKNAAKGIAFIVIAALSGGITSAVILESKFNKMKKDGTLSNYYLNENGTIASPNAFVNNVLNKVSPSVVSISRISNGFTEDSLSKYNGSGIIYHSKGYIVTNYDIIKSWDKIYVKIANNNDVSYEGKLIGVDEDTNLAIIKIDEFGLDTVEFGESSYVMPGDSAIAIGNVMGSQFGNYASLGIVSGTNFKRESIDKQSGIKTMYNILHTDVDINSNNNGGPLCNEKGEVIGINIEKTNVDTGKVETYAIASDEIVHLINLVGSYSKVTKPSLGITVSNIVDAGDGKVGLRITKVNVNSTSEAAGLKNLDIITEVYGTQIKKEEDLSNELEKFRIGEVVKVKVIRDNEELEFNVKLQEK